MVGKHPSDGAEVEIAKCTDSTALNSSLVNNDGNTNRIAVTVQCNPFAEVCERETSPHIARQDRGVFRDVGTSGCLNSESNSLSKSSESTKTCSNALCPVQVEVSSVTDTCSDH